MAEIAPAATLPSVPGFAAVTPTSRVWQLIVIGLPDRIATGRKTVSSVVNSTRVLVRTVVPAGTAYDRVGSQFSQRTTPVAFVSVTFLPVAAKVRDAVSGNVRRSAGTTPAPGSGAAAAGSAVMVIDIGGRSVGWTTTRTVALGRTYSATTAAAAARRTSATRPPIARSAPRRGRMRAASTLRRVGR